MTVYAGLDEETLRTSPAVRPFRANAFRVLSTNADADSRQIEKQQTRLLIAIEFDPRRVEGAYGLKDLTQPEVSEAGYLLAQPDSRMLEELFWVHALDCDLRGSPAATLRAVRSQPDSATARHNLAALLTITAQESDPNAWEEALKQWKAVLGDALFWDFMKDRATLLQARNSNPAKLNAAVLQRLTDGLALHLAQAGKAKDVKLVALLARAVLPHLDWLDLHASLKSVGTEIIKEGFVSLGAILDRIAELRAELDKPSLQRRLAQTDQDLGRVAAEYGELHRSLADLLVGQDWEKALCSAYQRLLIASFRISGDMQQAQRIMEQAEGAIADVQLLGPIRREWQQMRWSVLFENAQALLQAGNYSQAEQKLDEAWGFSDEGQKRKIEALREACFFARAAADRQRSVEQRERWVQETVTAARGAHTEAQSFHFRKWMRWAMLAGALVAALAAAMVPRHPRRVATRIAPPSPPSSPVANPASGRFSAERETKVGVEQSLTARRSDLERERSDLEKQRASLEAVAAAYQGELVPRDGQQVYHRLCEDYESKVQQHKRKLVQWQADEAAYLEGLNGLQARAEQTDGLR